MEVINKKKASCKFDEIEKGQCFVIDTDIDGIYMRMKVVNAEYTFAAVDLTTGQIYAFNPDQTVIPIEAKVVIENFKEAESK